MPPLPKVRRSVPADTRSMAYCLRALLCRRYTTACDTVRGPCPSDARVDPPISDSPHRCAYSDTASYARNYYKYSGALLNVELIRVAAWQISVLASCLCLTDRPPSRVQVVLSPFAFASDTTVSNCPLSHSPRSETQRNHPPGPAAKKARNLVHPCERDCEGYRRTPGTTDS